MNEQEFEKSLNDLKNVNANLKTHQKYLMYPILKARSTSWIGFILICVPVLFLLGVVLKEYLDIEFAPFTGLYWLITEKLPDSDSSIISWLVRSLLLLGPFIVLLINLLAITTIFYDKDTNQIYCSIELKWLNLILILLSILIILTFIGYLIFENIQ
ncbi:MAG: hypothetical protein RLO81_18185 [Fulvivirga sp.]|uniref:hypothetical protein n=1 Tax=Fulvivirga sp. TaxID=1931237 RepID=UPI0032EF938A